MGGWVARAAGLRNNIWEVDTVVLQVHRIVVGRQGAAIGEIGIKARREMESIFQNRVHLFLSVVVQRR